MHSEALEHIRTEGGAERHVGGVAPARHDDTSGAGHVVAGIERIPAAAEIDLEPGAEIHRLGLGGNADVAEIPGAITRRDVHAAAQRDRQVGKVAAHAATLDHDVGGGPGRAGVLVAEGDMGMNEIADRLHARPARRCRAEAGPSRVHETIGLAVSAAQQEDQRVVRQFRDLVCARRRFDRVGQARIRDQRVRGNCELACRRHQSATEIAERIQISCHRQRGCDAKLVGLDHVARPRRVHVEHQHHRRAPGKLIDHFEAAANLHG